MFDSDRGENPRDKIPYLKKDFPQKPLTARGAIIVGNRLIREVMGREKGDQFIKERNQRLKH